MRDAYFAMGSNLGDRAAHLAFAREAFRFEFGKVEFSPVFETEAVEVPQPQPPYLNQAVRVRTERGPADLLEWAVHLEADRGRARKGDRDARTLDVDLLLLGDLKVREPGLVIPHPGILRRRFVLVPLAALAPDVRIPGTGLTAAGALERAPATGFVRPYGPG